MTRALALSDDFLNAKYHEYKSALQDKRLPAAFIDWDLLRKNSSLVEKRARHLPVRLASKSLRSSYVIQKLRAEEQFIRGILAYSALEAAYLCAQGFDDVVIAYPTVDTNDITAVIPHLKRGAQICFMTDHRRHIEILNHFGKMHNLTIPIAIDVDLSVHYPMLHFGVYRSPVRTMADLKNLVADIKNANHVKLIGMMGYEAQMSACDNNARKPIMSTAITMLKRRSAPIIARRRQEAVSYLRSKGFHLAFVNGGGTATLESTVLDESVTEVTAGSAFFGPHSFDHFSDFSLYPAAGFALSVTRRPRQGFITCHGGGYVASGPHDALKLPQPFLPTGLEFVTHEGAGEVQTPLKLSRHHRIDVGDMIIFRHAKSGELAEHFNHFHIIVDGNVHDTVKTYRGDGHAFL